MRGLCVDWDDCRYIMSSPAPRFSLRYIAPLSTSTLAARVIEQVKLYGSCARRSSAGNSVNRAKRGPPLRVSAVRHFAAFAMSIWMS